MFHKSMLFTHTFQLARLAYHARVLTKMPIFCMNFNLPIHFQIFDSESDFVKIIIGLEGKLWRWHSYVGQLFNDDRSPAPSIVFFDQNEKRPPLTVEEVKYAILRQCNGKVVGPDDVHAEVLKLIAEQKAKGCRS